ncbi:hypothetical protein C8A01DRAFT_43217 [Parachaetomium inaequale]|uniref:Uncharacterized protein n=1 Tax=Parachaetomium inaequale TaxID=2588326 RepID=A0AAN6PMM2_9PEZI|nr:hypothetical protein C8A01DRAFT_43217 [Parachaetomium inaequale]
MGVVHEIVEPQCQALSDAQRCVAEATAHDDLFCRFHARQCFGLYMGYKRRNAELDALAGHEPPCLRGSKTPLALHAFEGYVLLGKVTAARKLHHKHFFSLEIDYSHKAYLDKLISTRQSVLKALENLERRTAELLYEKEKWYSWVRQVQDDEDQNREKEQKKIKLEAALLRRHWREMEVRLAAAREKEEKKRVAWDPIEDVWEEDRGRYLDLIRQFLWIEAPAAGMDVAQAAQGPAPPAGAARTSEQPEKVTVATEETAAEADGKQPESGQAKKPKKRGGKKKKKKKKKSKVSPPSKAKIERRDEVRARLREGVEKDYSHANGPMLVGTAQNPPELFNRSAPVGEEDVSDLIADITEIKMLLSCRQIMTHPALLPAALRAKSDSDLPLRDACADFVRGDEPDDDDEGSADKKVDLRPAAEYLRHRLLYDDLEPDFLMRALGALYRESKPSAKELLDAVANGGNPENTRMTVRICGRTIWNHASQGSMARAGWLHFSVMARDCSFQDAIGLCRNWDEFFELNLLALWQYFPASKWTGWSGNSLTEELTQLGFVPFHMDFSGRENTTYTHLDRLNRKTVRRQHTILESRNFVCAHMKRNDPVTRRFIHYAVMRPSEQMILVRDGIDGRIIVAPNQKDRWIVRSRRGVTAVGCNTHDDNWDVELEVGPLFFDTARASRKWHFGFSSYYEVYMWDFVPGKKPIDMYHYIREVSMLSKARRITGNRGKYTHMKHIMETPTREQDTKRVRQIKPGEDVQSLYDELTGPNAEFWIKTTNSGTDKTTEDIAPGVSPYIYDNNTDAAEDAILFEGELRRGFPEDMPYVEIKNPMQQLESSRLPLSVLNRMIKQMEDSMPPALEQAFGIKRGLEGKEEGKDRDKEESTGFGPMSDSQPYDPGSGQFPYSVPPIWEQARKKITPTACDAARASLLDRVGFSSAKFGLTVDEVFEMAGKQEIMERDRACVHKDSFHLGDLEPGAQERYTEAMRLIIGLNLELYYDEYNPQVMSPWPHRYIVQDIVHAFMMMGLFFPGVKETSVVQEYLESEEGRGFKASKLFDPASRCAKRPDVRTRASSSSRSKAFWDDWVKLYEGDKHYLDAYPWDWSLAVKPTLAKLYKAGMIGPAARETRAHLVPGHATANTEPHRPGQLDLFIRFDNTGKYSESVPPTFVDYKDWPQLLPRRAPSPTNARPEADPGSRSIMVMGEDEKDLLRWCTVVTFALQTKPWLREVDLWKSFVNVGLEFLEGLDEFWLD